MESNAKQTEWIAYLVKAIVEKTDLVTIAPPFPLSVENLTFSPSLDPSPNPYFPLTPTAASTQSATPSTQLARALATSEAESPAPAKCDEGRDPRCSGRFGSDPTCISRHAAS